MHEETPVDLILTGHSMENVFAEIESILEKSEPEAISHTLGFLRDASLIQHPFRDRFQKHLTASTVWDALQRLLTAPNFSVRANAIYTVGKLTNRNRAYILSEAFPFYFENDPINLPSLLGELAWLTNKWNWSFIQKMATAKHFLQRWSLCQVLDDGGNPTEIAKQFLEILAQLKADPHPLLAAEATLQFERIKIKLGPKLSKSEWRKEVERISSLEPRITFESAGMQFMRDKTDYTVAEFDSFVTGLVQG
jgi:hypothetical protein